MDLSIARAASIKTFLKSEGVADYQVEIIGYGGDKPLTDNSTEAHRRKNRRVEIRVLRQ
jgi:outer membrane protein OmpA-like peptidoglycan-associated protein